MSDEARYEARWLQHLIRTREDAMKLQRVRVYENAFGDDCANLDDLIEAVEEIAANEDALSVATVLRELASALRGLRDG